MNQAHIHLLITHLPIFGSVLGAFVLAHALWTKTNATKMAAYCIFVLSAVGAGIAYLTGEGAEEAVENLPGVLETAIEQHEEVALFALISLIVLGVASLVALWITSKNKPQTRSMAFVVFFLALISFGIVARTGYLGGQIRHTEIAAGAQPTAPETGGEAEDDD